MVFGDRKKGKRKIKQEERGNLDVWFRAARGGGLVGAVRSSDLKKLVFHKQSFV